MKKSPVGIQLIIGGVFLLNFWLTAISAIGKGTVFAYQNYWGAPQEKYTLVFMLLLATPIYFILVWRHLRPKRTEQPTPETRPSVLTPISQQLYKARSKREASKKQDAENLTSTASKENDLS